MPCVTVTFLLHSLILASYKAPPAGENMEYGVDIGFSATDLYLQVYLAGDYCSFDTLAPY